MAPKGYSGSGWNRPHVTRVQDHLVVDSTSHLKKKTSILLKSKICVNQYLKIYNKLSLFLRQFFTSSKTFFCK
jgi:hypothetical protein